MIVMPLHSLKCIGVVLVFGGESSANEEFILVWALDTDCSNSSSSSNLSHQFEAKFFEVVHSTSYPFANHLMDACTCTLKRIERNDFQSRIRKELANSFCASDVCGVIWSQFGQRWCQVFHSTLLLLLLLLWLLYIINYFWYSKGFFFPLQKLPSRDLDLRRTLRMKSLLTSFTTYRGCKKNSYHCYCCCWRHQPQFVGGHTSNRFSSVKLFQVIMGDHNNIGACGTSRKNKKYYPKEFKKDSIYHGER